MSVVVLLLVVGDPPGATRACAEAFRRAAAGEVRGALRAAREAVRERDDAQSRLALGWALILAGRGEQGYELFRAERARAGVGIAPGLGEVALWMEDYDTARRELRGASSAPAAELAFRTGEWDAARAWAVGGTLGRLHALTGDVASARATFEQEPSLAAQAGLGLLELSVGNAARAVVHLRSASQLARLSGLREPNIVQWAGDLIESEVRLGRSDAARRSLAELDRLAQLTRRRWARAAAERCRGMLVAAGEVDATFARAEELARRVPAPFDHARMELCWGERLRRDGRRVEARRRLGAALAGFEALGAAPWAERAAGELRGSGARARRGPRARGNELTAQETRIVQLVCEGLTNKAVAAQLFLSPRTVETHLAHVFRKLGVRTRTELAYVLSERAGGEATAQSSTA